MHISSHLKQSLTSRLLLATITSISAFAAQGEALYINDKQPGHLFDNYNLNDIRVETNGTEATITNSSIDGSLFVLFGAKVTAENTTIRCTTANCKGIDIQGSGHDSTATGERSNFIGSDLTITSNSDGLSSTGSTLVDLAGIKTVIKINSGRDGVSLNGSVSKNNVINTAYIDNFDITAGRYGVSAIMGAQLKLSNGTVFTSSNNGHGVELGGANYNGSAPIQTKAYINNVTVHTAGDQAYGIYSEQLTATGSGGNRGAISDWNNSHIITDGAQSIGIVANYSSNEVNFQNGTINTYGDKAYGIWSRGSADVYLNTSKVATKGINAIGVCSYLYGNTGLFNATSVETQGEGAHGAVVQYAGNISLNDGSIRSKGLDAGGIYMLMGTAENNNIRSGSTVDLQKSSIISEQGYGIAAAGGELDVKLSNNSLLQGKQGLMNVQDYTGTVAPKWDQGVTTVNVLVDSGSTVIGKVHTASSAIANMALSDNSIWQFDQSSNLTNLSNDHSTVQFISNSVSPHTLTVNGNYTGNDGLIIMNGQLGSDNSPIDKLIINGDSSGNTYVQVNNLGGLGAKTINGIEIINVNGNSDGNFVQAGRIVSGAYDYSLVRGADAATVNNWYLTSSATKEVLRPEAGSYLANLVAANSMFNLRLPDRQGETSYIDFATGECKTTSMWLRYQYRHNKFGAGNQLNVKNDWTVTQLGGDIAVWSSNGKNRFHLGVMGGYGRSTNDVDANLKGNRSSGKIDGYSIGLYGTWYQNDVTKTGTYVDSWIMWNDLDGSVNGQSLNTEKYDLSGINASLESGYTFLAKATDYYNLWLQPQGQMMWMGIDADEHTESNGSKVTGDGDNLQTRLGLRAILDSNKTTADFGGQIFVETNWLYNSKPFSIKMDSDRVYQSGSRNIAEIKAGIESMLYRDANIWVNVGHQRGDHHYRNLALMFGAQLRF
ncbi:autotransporter outer membrane beta-barrel domain-containing protein [Orbus sturtevantii]|uniref:autotransporter outer membrane beta-barrel domain-containing protein n=1 Tax=Orbus sturtevantii TaxID=3074109 RepID=UPI00370D96BF